MRKKLTVKQLEAFSKEVHLPFAYLFLPEPLKKTCPSRFSEQIMPQQPVSVSRNNHYLSNALSKFLDADETDAWLIAYALVDTSNITIVTHEVSELNRKNKVKIPRLNTSLDP
jgi:hypothetical protein